MEPPYTIGQFAQAAGVPTSTVRYYERTGLLCPAGRTRGNYLRYGVEALACLRFIRAAQAIGFTLEDVTALLQLRDAPASACLDVQARIEARLADLERRLADLQQVQRVLPATLTRCRETQWNGRCHIIETFTTLSASPRNTPTA